MIIFLIVELLALAVCVAAVASTVWTFLKYRKDSERLIELLTSRDAEIK